MVGSPRWRGRGENLLIDNGKSAKALMYHFLKKLSQNQNLMELNRRNSVHKIASILYWLEKTFVLWYSLG